MGRLKRSAIAFAAAALSAPAVASAHLVESGVSPFYDGAAHLFVSPDDLVVVLALALFAGLNGRVAAKRLVIALPLAWLAGLAAGLLLPGPSDTPWLPAGSLVIGVLVAINPKLGQAAESARPPALPPNASTLIPTALGLILGLAHGYLNGRAIADTDTSPLAGAGIVGAVTVVVLLAAALTTTLREPWQRIAIRTLGSWAAAFALLAIAWTFRS